MKKKIVAFLLAVGLFTAPGCNQYLDVNVDPFLPQEAPPDQFLPQIIYALGEGPMFDVRFVGRYAQHWQWTTANDNYDRHGRRGLGGGLAGSQTHRNHYWAIGSNLNQMEQQAAKRGFNRYAGIATAMRAYSWQISTDLFGEMPYQQAWDNSRTKFDYDTQKFIYEQVDKLCDEAIAKLADDTGTLDPLLARMETIYGGDPQKWTRFMYGIKARLAHHVSNKRSYNPQRVIQLVDQALRSNDDDARTPFTAELGRNADFYSFMGPLRNNFLNMRQGNTIVNLLRGQFTNNVPDPRLLLMFNPALADQQVRGLNPTQGIPTGQTASFPLMYGKGIFRDTEPYPLLTYAELQFVKAEAALRLGNRALALTAFQNGVRAHMTRLGVPAAEQANFLATGLPSTAEALELRHIMSQKYVALYGQIEVWSDLRRHNYNGQIFMGYTLPTNLAAENNGKPVQRLLPPSFSEEDWNSAAFRAIGGYDLDYHTKPVWFATTEE